MLSSFKEANKPLPIPFSNEYKIDVTGKIFNTEGVEQSTYRNVDGRLKFKGELFNGNKEYDVAVLVAWAYKGMQYPYYHVDKLDVWFVDGDYKNIHPSNLIWRFPKERLLYKGNPDFAYIPNFSRYIISRKGVLINLDANTEVKPFFEMRYAKFRLRSDTGYIHLVGRYRLVALAWFDYPANVGELVVNHINGVPGDDWIENLEFTTREKNNHHAIETGLITKDRTVLVRNCNTGEVTEYSGTSTCANSLGLHRTTVQFRLHTENQPVYHGGLQFKYRRDPTPWREPNPEELESLELNKGTPIPVYFRNVFTGTVMRADGVPTIARITGIPATTIHGRLKLVKRTYPVQGYEFSYTDGPWESYSKDDLFVIKENPIGKIFAYVITDTKTGIAKTYPNTKTVTNELALTSSMVSYYMKKQKLYRGRYLIRPHRLSESHR